MPRLFYEFNVIQQPPKNALHCFKQKKRVCENIGYKHMAYNNEVEVQVTKGQARMKSDNMAKHAEMVCAMNKDKSGAMDIVCYHRVTVPLINAGMVTQLFRESFVKNADILAVTVPDENLYTAVVKANATDVISFDLNSRPYFLKKKHFSIAQSSGIYFEIQCGALLTAGENRPTIIANAQYICSFTRGQNIILTGGTSNVQLLRSPYDMANMYSLPIMIMSYQSGVLFGLTEQQAIDAVSTNCEKVLKHAKSRLTTTSTIDIQEVAQLSTEDKWKKKTLEDVLKEPVVRRDTKNGKLGGKNKPNVTLNDKKRKATDLPKKKKKARLIDKHPG